MNNKGILLETGTGELEILEFIVNNKHYAINVIKVKEVLDVDNLTKLPQTKEGAISYMIDQILKEIGK